MSLRSIFKGAMLVTASAALIAVITIAGILALAFYYSDGGRSWSVSITRVSDALTYDGTEYDFSGDALLGDDRWAILIGEDGRVIWSLRKPADVPERYSLTDIASFTRWYLNDYPVQCRFRDDGLDIIYAPWPRGTATAALVASAFSGIPFATAARGDNLEPADPDLAFKLREALFIRANNAADKARIEALPGAHAAGKTRLVYNSLTLPAIDVPSFSGFHSPPRLFAIGRFDVTKGFDVLLRACALLRDRGVDFRLTLAGGGGKTLGLGNMGEKLHALRRELGLEQLVSMPGLVSHDDLPGLLRSQDIFLAPCVIDPATGMRDGIPNTVIEALSFGLPVIASTVNALPEIVRHEQTGLAVPPGDHVALADAVQRLLASPEEARRLAAAGFQLARDMSSPEANARRLAELFLHADNERQGGRDSSCAV